MVEGHAAASTMTFEDLVRDALLHLYDPAYLQTHPLARLVDLPPGHPLVLRGKRLMQVLLETIEALRPAAGTASDSRAWRSYQILELRYVEGLSAAEVFGRLALSKTQYQRDHACALKAVASSLRDRWQLDPSGEPGAGSVESRGVLALTEAEHLAATLTPDPIDLTSMLRGLLDLLEPVSQESQVSVSLRSRPDLPLLHADRVALRQAFLGLFSAALAHGAAGALEVALELRGSAVEVTLSRRVAAVPGVPLVANPADAPEVGVARRFVEALGGDLQLAPSAHDGSWQAKVTLPAAQRPLVLVLDNHADFIQLVSRYLAEHDWQVVGAQDVQQALLLARELQPTVILLDVLMPGQDGWDLLLALKGRPETRAIPVIVCSVLYEPQVARALGAAAYLAKPITQAQLLAALAPWCRGSRVPASAR